VCLSIFLLVLSPIVIHRIECCQEDAIIGRIIVELSNYDNVDKIENQGQVNTYGPNWINGIKLLGWSIIPIFVIFVPIGLIPIFKQLKYPNYVLVLLPIVLAIPVMYSVSIAPDTRYVYPLFPILCVISLFGIKWIASNFDNKKLILGIIVSGIILGSMIFLDFKKIDYMYDDEVYEISKIIIKDIKGVNSDSNALKFFKAVEIEDRWPITEYSGPLRESLKIKQLSPEGFSSLVEFIEFGQKNGLTHLVIDNNQNIQTFFVDVYNNEEKYQYLVKEYDSQEQGYSYHVKKFRINYQEYYD